MRAVLLALLVAACGEDTPPGPPTIDTDGLYGSVYSGQYHLGPVDFAESEWHNACAPGGGYRAALRDETGLGGEYLAGVESNLIAGGANCDTCVFITTGTGRTIVARVVTYGSTQPYDLDVSPSVYAELNSGEWPRAMTWQWAKCPDTGTLEYEFQTGANVWWTSFWVRNQRVPVVKVEVRSANNPSFTEARRAGDGTCNFDSGFGEGEFTIRLTSIDGQVIEDTFPGFTPGGILVSTRQFQ